MAAVVIGQAGDSLRGDLAAGAMEIEERKEGSRKLWEAVGDD